MSQPESPRAASPPETEFVFAREVDAPRDLVFTLWTDPGHLKHWFMPKGYSGRIAKLDFRPGGTYHYCLQGPDAPEMWGKWEFREIVAPERLVFVNAFSDEAGGLTRHPLAPDWPLRMMTTVTFTERAGRTTLTVRWAPISPSEAEARAFEAGRASMQQGWTGTMEMLAEYLKSLGAGRAS